MHAYPLIAPKQVRLRCVSLTSYGFLHTPPLASDALAIRIIFPSIGVMQTSTVLLGLPASLGKQKRRTISGSPFSHLCVHNFNCIHKLNCRIHNFNCSWSVPLTSPDKHPSPGRNRSNSYHQTHHQYDLPLARIYLWLRQAPGMRRVLCCSFCSS